MAKTGDKFWTMLIRVSRSDSVLAASPYATEHIHISRNSIEENTFIEVPPSPIKANTVLDSKAELEEAVFIEVSKITSGNVHAEVVPVEEWPDQCPLNMPGHSITVTPKEKSAETSQDSEGKLIEDLFQTEREETIEWRGTEQNIREDHIKNRTETFNEYDVRGNKNDLLDGHL